MARTQDSNTRITQRHWLKFQCLPKSLKSLQTQAVSGANKADKEPSKRLSTKVKSTQSMRLRPYSAWQSKSVQDLLYPRWRTAKFKKKTKNKKQLMNGIFTLDPFLQMHLSLKALVAQIRLQSVFYIACNPTRDNNVKPRVTDAHWSGWAWSMPLQAEQHGGQHQSVMNMWRKQVGSYVHTHSMTAIQFSGR